VSERGRCAMALETREGSDGAGEEGMWTSYAGSCQVGRGTWAA